MFGLYDAFMRQVLADENHPAVLDADAVYTFGQLAKMSEAASVAIPEKSGFAGIVLDHSVWMIASMLGVLKTGAAYVPAEPDFPIDRTRFMMQESHVSIIITQQRYADRFTDFPVVFIEEIMDIYQQMVQQDQVIEAEAAQLLRARQDIRDIYHDLGHGHLLEDLNTAIEHFDEMDLSLADNLEYDIERIEDTMEETMEAAEDEEYFNMEGSAAPDFSFEQDNWQTSAQEKALSWMQEDHEGWSHDPAYILYTSGSTGVPKGVVVTSANVLHYVQAFYEEFHPGPEDIMLQYSVCSFDIFTEEVFTTLLCGAALYIPAPEVHDNLPVLLKECQKHQVTEISGFPYLLKEMNTLPLPSSIRLLISGGDVLRESYVENLLGKVKIYNTYGPSETTVCASYFDCVPGSALQDGTFPIGHPVYGTGIEILDENLEPVEDGQMGEICIYGEGVASGYLDASKNEMFLMHNGKPMYRSGDLGCILPDGNLAFFGRLDDQVMIWGKRVEPKEVESVLCKCHGVAEAVVTTEEDSAHMHHIKAYVKPEDNLDIESLKEEMRHSLTSFMIPETFVLVDAIPLSDRGKPDTRKLASMESGR